MHLDLDIIEKDGGTTPIGVDIVEVLLAGYTGRDQVAVVAHIRELEELGVMPPPRVPMVYTVSSKLLQLDPVMSVETAETSGETEVYFIPTAEGLLIGTGSDHTDRKQEAIDVAASKGMTPKVVSRQVWRFDDVLAHWDEIQIRSWSTDESGRRLYQEGTLAAFLALEAIIGELSTGGYALDNRLVFCGTLPAIGGLQYGHTFEGELHDPVLDRHIGYRYDIEVLPS
jgi:hypothetical protein